MVGDTTFVLQCCISCIWGYLKCRLDKEQHVLEGRYELFYTETLLRRAVLLHLAGPEVQTVFETLSGTGDDYASALAKLTHYF